MCIQDMKPGRYRETACLHDGPTVSAHGRPAGAPRSHDQHPKAPHPVLSAPRAVLLSSPTKSPICKCNAHGIQLSYSLILTQEACIDPRNPLVFLTLRGKQRFNQQVFL